MNRYKKLFFIMIVSLPFAIRSAFSFYLPENRDYITLGERWEQLSRVEKLWYKVRYGDPYLIAEKLHAACNSEDAQLIKTILDTGGKEVIESRCHYLERRPLWRACINGLVYHVGLLLHAGANPNITTNCCAAFTCTSGKISFNNRESLINCMFRRFREYLLYDRPCGKYIMCIEALLKYGASLSDISDDLNQLEEIRAISLSFYRFVFCNALILACENQDILCVQALMRWKANKKVKDKEGNTPLHYAACKGNLAIAKLLLRQS